MSNWGLPGNTAEKALAADPSQKPDFTIPTHVEERLTALATRAAEQAVAKIWNDAFLSMVEKEIKRIAGSSEGSTPPPEPLPTPKSSPSPAVEVVAPTAASAKPATVTAAPFSILAKAKGRDEVIDRVSSAAVKQLDIVFLKIVNTFSLQILELARNSIDNVLKLSSTFLDDKAKNALLEFHDLYFGANNAMTEASRNVNSEIDHLVAELQEKIAKGQEVTLDGREEEKARINRLSLAVIQKKLETIISIDDGIKEHLLPVLSNMQFEGILNQRISHVNILWEFIVETQTNEEVTTFFNIRNKLAKLPTSPEEREQFFRIVTSLGGDPDASSSPQPDSQVA